MLCLSEDIFLRNLAFPQDKAKCLGCILHLCHLIPALPNDKAGGQELEEHGEGGGGGRHRDGEALFEVD